MTGHSASSKLFFPAISTLLLCLLVSSGCSYFDGQSADKSVVGTKKSLADQKLEAIQEKESLVFLEFTVRPEEYEEEEMHRRFMEISLDYELLISSNPEYVYGYILYGKFLRRVNEREKANKMFMKANKLSPNIASVKQQIGNYLSEEGVYELALPYFLAAIELSPDTALYHYQLGELLFTYRYEYIKDGALEEPVLERQMHDAFKRAAELEPDNRDFRFRFAESYYDLKNPDYNSALNTWQDLLDSAKSKRESMLITLHKARVYILMGQTVLAKPLIDSVNLPSLEDAKKELLAMIN